MRKLHSLTSGFVLMATVLVLGLFGTFDAQPAHASPPLCMNRICDFDANCQQWPDFLCFEYQGGVERCYAYRCNVE